MKYQSLTPLFGSFLLLLNVSELQAMHLNEVEFGGSFYGASIGRARPGPGIVVVGQDKSAHYQLISKPYPVPSRYSVYFGIDVGTDPAGTNSTPVGVGILSGDQSVWLKDPSEKTFYSQLGTQQGVIEMDGNQTHSVLVFTNQGQNQALANFTVRYVIFKDADNNCLPARKQKVHKQKAPKQPQVYAPQGPGYYNPWPPERDSRDGKGSRSERSGGRF